MKEITFNQESIDESNLTAEGRNGTMLCRGAAIIRSSDKKRITIMPINSKGKLGRCSIDIPFSAIPEIMVELSDALMRVAK